MKKFMLSHNFIRVITFISILLLVFAVSAHDPVYAKMQTMDEDSLAQIDGQEGITFGLDLTVRSSAYSISLSGGLTGDQSINFGYTDATTDSFIIGDGTASGSFGVNTNLTVDVGSNTTDHRPWLLLSGLVFPSADTVNGICISANDINIVDPSGGNKTIGNLAINGLFMGQSVTAVGGAAIAPFYTAGVEPWIRLSSHDPTLPRPIGLDIYGELGLYVDNVKFAYNSTNSMNISGIYIYGASTNVADGNPALWPTLTGNAKIGGIFSTYAADGTINGTYDAGPATVDVGSSGGQTRVNLNIPMSASIRVRDFQIDPTRSFGPLALDNLIIYRNIVTIRSL